MSPWDPVTEPPAHREESATVVLVAGRTFCVSAGNGDLLAGAADGLFAGDFRVLHRVELDVDGAHVEVLGVERPGASACRFVGRVPGEPGHGSIVVLRERRLDPRFVDGVELRNHGEHTRRVRVRYRLESDRAFIFDVKDGRDPGARSTVTVRGEGVDFTSALHGSAHTVRVEWRGADASAAVQDRTGAVWWDVELAPGGRWTGGLEVALDDVPRAAVAAADGPVTAWRGASAVHCRSWYFPLDMTVARSVRDLDALRLVDPEGRHRPTIAAGAPWFMTMFGRDSLLTGWMVLPGDPELALGVLDALARSQGTVVDARRDEEPGKIMHEVRAGPKASDAANEVYYGSADATPLFVMLLDELDRWGGLTPADRARLLPAADRALAWIDEYGDRDGDGFVEYRRGSPSGLRNQGWKDSWDGVRFADGTVAEPPIALCEVQAYVYGAYVARARLAARADDGDGCVRWYGRAHELAARFDAAFWCEAAGGYALALDADKRQVDSTTSNMGHALWTGIASPERARRVAETLLDDGLWGGWGIRTLSGRGGGFDPLSYHCGSVWPHDNALVAAGLARYGHREAANRVVLAQIDAAEQLEGSLPELFAGFSRDDVSVPVRYPTSCSPQAWSAASPLLHLRTVLGLDVDATGVLHVDPQVPEEFGSLCVSGVRAGGHLYEVRATGRTGTVVRLDDPPV